MMTVKRFFLTAALAVALALPVHGYNDVVTHPQLTIIATEKSALYTDASIMFNLGLLPADKQFFLYRARGNDLLYGSATYPLSSFVGEGAFDEDTGLRPRNHFFDPRFDRGLTWGVFSFYRSWEWMLEEQATISGQHRSLSDARGYLRKALTFNEGTPAVSDNARGIAMAEMFLSLGHVAHHLQDMAQPQHVRNDIHLDRYPILYGLYDPSRYELYTAERGPFVQVLAEMANPVFPGAANFNTARDFWTNRANTGIAQFTNRNYVSKRTNFTISNGVVNTGTYAEPLPGAAQDFTVESLFAASGVSVPSDVQALCGSPAIDCTMTMYSTTVSPKASTLSIFDQDLRQNGKTLTYKPGDVIFPTYETERLFALNRFNFDDAHQQLIGRAVAYSAGFINHFFRGKLEVLAPAAGPYAVVDHSTGQGFKKIRARVKNATPGQALPSGRIQAIAKFHVNECYKDDLSGEFTLDGNGQLVPPCGPGARYRTEEARLRLTAEEVVGFGIGETKEMTFTFTEPIPLNATDLILQVFYQGMVGEEVESFALGAADLSEPTFAAVMNATDVFELNGTAFYDYDEITADVTQPPFSVVDLNGDGKYLAPPDVNVVGGDIRYEIFVDGQKVGDVPALPEGRFARIAALVSPFGFQLSLAASGNGFNSFTSYEFGSKIFQYDPGQNAVLISPVAKLRNAALQWASVSFYHYYPTTGTPLSKMPASTATDAIVLIPVQMAPGTLLRSGSPELAPQQTETGDPRGNRAQTAVGSPALRAPKE